MTLWRSENTGAKSDLERLGGEELGLNGTFVLIIVEMAAKLNVTFFSTSAFTVPLCNVCTFDFFPHLRDGN